MFFTYIVNSIYLYLNIGLYLYIVQSRQMFE